MSSLIVVMRSLNSVDATREDEPTSIRIEGESEPFFFIGGGLSATQGAPDISLSVMKITSPFLRRVCDAQRLLKIGAPPLGTQKISKNQGP